MANQLPDAIVAEIARLTKQGLSTRDIAAKLGVSRVTVNTWQKKLDVYAECRHGKRLNECSSCIGMKRVVMADGTTEFHSAVKLSRRRSHGQQGSR